MVFRNTKNDIRWKEGFTGIAVEDVFIQDFGEQDTCSIATSGMLFWMEMDNFWFGPSSFRNVVFDNVHTKWNITFLTETNRQVAFRAKDADLPGIPVDQDGYVTTTDNLGFEVMGTNRGCVPVEISVGACHDCG